MNLFDSVLVRFILSNNLTTCFLCGRKKSELSQLCRHRLPAVEFQMEISSEPEIWRQRLKELNLSFISLGTLPYT